MGKGDSVRNLIGASGKREMTYFFFFFTYAFEGEEGEVGIERRELKWWYMNDRDE